MLEFQLTTKKIMVILLIYNLECLKNIVKENYNIKAKKIDKLVAIPIDIVIVPYSFL